MTSSRQNVKPAKDSSRQKATKFSLKPAKSNASRQNAGNAGSADNPEYSFAPLPPPLPEKHQRLI